MARYEMRDTRYETGSAIILAVVLTSLLAIVGVMFVMVARVDNVATSAISENRELNFAIETVIAKMSQELVLDVPGMPKGREYYDYPGEEDEWLANLEPYQSGSNYYWRRISDVYNKNFPIPSQGLQAVIVPDYQVSSQIGDSNNSSYYRADADGDGVADSVWVRIPEMTSNKGKPIYAAVRVIDDGGMINVNTARQFDPNSAVEKEIDGSSQTQINLLALSERGTTSNPLGKLDKKRFGYELPPYNLNDYIRDVVWRYNEPNGLYTPFDISDELKLRNRYILNYNLMVSRIEELWENVYDVGPRTPIPTSAYPFSRWPNCTILGTIEPNDYDYRHISTIYNMDRIIDPDGDKMVNINKDSIGLIYDSMKKAFGAELNFVADVNGVAAQITVNLIDYRDIDSDVTDYNNPDDGKIYYGFERPCVYISELAHRFKETESLGGPAVTETYRSYAVELYKPYVEDGYPEPNQWRLFIDNSAASPPGNLSVTVKWMGTRQFHVIKWENVTNVPLDVDFEGDSDSNLAGSSYDMANTFNKIFDTGSIISLQRKVNGIWISVDSAQVPEPAGGWLEAMDGTAFSVQRNITPHKCIRRLWANPSSSLTLGGYNNVPDGDSIYIQAHPYLNPLIYPERGFRNIGEIGMLFRKDVYSRTWNSTDTESDVRLNLADPNYQGLFKYLTVFDPTRDNIDNDGDGSGIAEVDADELKVPGRININTAPWYVIAQLPWMTPDIAQNVVSYRDDHDGFESIGELMNVIGMDYYKTQIGDLAGFPDLTTPDHPLGGAADDFEERDVIFARISNLVAVRSDVFTAYILVRIGTDGPQKRVIAVLDRSDVYPTGDDKVRVIALHPVPDPR